MGIPWPSLGRRVAAWLLPHLKDEIEKEARRQLEQRFQDAAAAKYPPRPPADLGGI